MGLQLIKHGLDLPSLAVHGCQLRCRCCGRIKHIGEQAIALGLPWPPEIIQLALDDPHHHGGLVSVAIGNGVQTRVVRAVLQDYVPGEWHPHGYLPAERSPSHRYPLPALKAVQAPVGETRAPDGRFGIRRSTKRRSDSV